jgi:DNA-binding winged helix-turn-helix (wHTH) protein/Flp pilus assembly protein TadD
MSNPSRNGTPKQAQPIYEFGPFRVLPSDRLLVRSGEHVPLTAKAFDVLLVMIRKRGHLVEKSALMMAVWADSFVEEGNLAVTISMLRKALDENGEHKYIQTVPGHGYRFVADVREIAEIRSLAVLPFQHSNPLQETPEYLAVGLADSIITKLVGTGELVVRSTSAVLKYVDAPIDPVAVGREQKVDAIVTGYIDTSFNPVRITAQMIWARDGSLIWADTFEEDPQRIFAIGGRVADRIAQLTSNSTRTRRAEQKRMPRPETQNPEAYRLYLQGRYFWNKRTKKGLLRSIEYFRQATTEDPQYSLAYAGLADSFVLLGSYGVESAQRVYPSAEAAARKALELDDALAEAHASQGMISFYFEWNWTKAEEEFRLAIALNPNYALTCEWYAIALAALGRQKDALDQIRRAQSLDPLSLIINTAVGRVFYLGRHYDLAINAFCNVFDLDPNFARAHTHLGTVYAARGGFDEALREFEEARRLSEFDPYLNGLIGYTYALSGDTGKAHEVLASLSQQSDSNRYVPAFTIALVYIGLGDKGLAFKWLERAWHERSTYLAFAKTDPLLDQVRSDPRFNDLLRQMKLS